MRRLLVFLSVLVLFLAVSGVAKATMITFNFDPPGLADGSNAAAISTYMSSLFGGANSVAVSATGVPTSELNGLLGGANDGYIESEATTGHIILITFNTPITSVSFDWARARDQFNADYSTNNGSTFTNFLQDGPDNNGSGNNGSGHLNTFSLPAGVTVLYFHDGGQGEVGIDNLVVNKAETVPTVPEPATMLLLGSGLVGLAGFARKKFKK